jgi:hypothetical protein
VNLPPSSRQPYAGGVESDAMNTLPTTGIIQSIQWPPQGYIAQGWQCPICQAIYAPWVIKCESCGSESGAGKKPEMTEEQ